MDLSWVEEYPIGALVYAFQGGMESGNALIDVLYGDAQPGGRLTDTVPRHYEDAPSYGHFGGRDFNEYREDICVRAAGITKPSPRTRSSIPSASA